MGMTSTRKQRLRLGLRDDLESSSATRDFQVRQNFEAGSTWRGASSRRWWNRILGCGGANSPHTLAELCFETVSIPRQAIAE